MFRLGELSGDERDYYAMERGTVLDTIEKHGGIAADHVVLDVLLTLGVEAGTAWEMSLYEDMKWCPLR